MKKYQLILIIVFGTVMALWIIGRATNGLQYYSIPTKSNEPAYKTGSHIFSSNLITPKRFDFICYKVTDPDFGKQIWFHRVCGMPGDTIEIREGDLFVNGESQDQHFNLKKLYLIPRELIASLDFEEGEAIPLDGTDSVLVPLETIRQQDLIQHARRYAENSVYPGTEKIYGHPWTGQNFGPYIVPANNYFVLGDNRNFSQDSRFTGPVNKERSMGVVL